MRFTKPNARYHVELCQVRDAADDLLGYLADQPNMLPIGFPSDAVMTLCTALRQLPQGSVEGSVPILEAGREQSPTIRRNYIPLEISPNHPDYNPDAPPVFRGGELDVLINDLYVAIGTAIDSFKAEYGQDFRETIEIDPPVAAMPEFVLDAAIENARRAELHISNFASENSEVLANIDELQRGLVDADSELKVARSTAAMPAPKPNLLSRIGETISKIPEALQAVGIAAQVATDVANPVFEAGAKIILSGWQSMLDAISIAGAGMEESGRRLAAWRDQGWRKTEIAESAEDFYASKDDGKTEPFDLETVRQRIIEGLELPNGWEPQVEQLSLGGIAHSNWRNMTESCNIISRCKNLKYLDMSTAPLENDVLFLASLKELREIRLSNTRIISLNGINNLPKLRILHLNGAAQLADIDAVADLGRVTSLQIRSTAVRSLKPLLELNDLEILVIASDQFSADEMYELEIKFPALKIQNTLRRRRRRQRILGPEGFVA